MPSMVCQHCHEQLSIEEGIAVKDGYSYHKKCHKCYVCSETNLKNAEVFKGVIFCYPCSQRIFQGCSTARKSKNGNRKAAYITRVKRRNKSLKKRGPDNIRHRHLNGTGVLELTRLEASSNSGSSTAKVPKKLSDPSTLPVPKLIQEVDHVIYDASKDFKKNSAEIGVTTEVTEELLRQMNCPVVNDIKLENKAPIPVPNPREKGDSHFNKTIICSDLRVAELGASTEIAHMALRKKSELPVIIKSQSPVKENGRSLTEQEDYDTSEYDDDFLESKYSLSERDESCWLNKMLEAIFKIPYRFFKNKVLDRSSLISIAIRKERYGHETFCELLTKLRFLFREEITEHQSRGVRRLYSTINRRRVPYKLGWLNLVAKVSEVITPEEVTLGQRMLEPYRCKHFRRSHSYRCMRAHVMKRAGPTNSELAIFRNKLKSLLLPPAFIRNAIGYTKKSPSVTSQACGSNPVTM